MQSTPSEQDLAVLNPSLQIQRTIKLLSIDDDPDVANALNRNLKQHGIELVTAYHGTQGYWMACTEKPDVIVIDLRMPRGNGEDVIQSIRSNALTRSIPIIVLSGANNFGIKQRVLDLGADCFLEKPAAAADILEAVRSLLPQ